jgi:hypothetical protein
MVLKARIVHGMAKYSATAKATMAALPFSAQRRLLL